MMYCKCRRHLSFDILLFLAICIGGNTPLWAQSRLDSIQQLDEVVVTAKSYKEVIPAQKMDKLTLQSLNSFSVADAIRYFSGIQIKDYGGIGGLKTVNIYNPQIQISAESETKRSIFREKDKTKRSKKESAQHSKSRNKSFVMTSVSAL